MDFMTGRFRLLLPGNVVYLRAEDMHAYPMVNNLKLLNIFFEHKHLIEIFPKIKGLIEDFHALQEKETRLYTDYFAYVHLRGLMDQLDTETLHSDDYSEYAAMACLIEFFVSILRQYKAGVIPSLKDKHPLMRHKMLEIFSDERLPTLFQREELQSFAGSFGLSWRSFERILPEMTGMTPRDLCLCNRFLHFLNILMAQREGSLEDIAHVSGFSDYRSMSRNCHRFFGASPKQVRAHLDMFAGHLPTFGGQSLGEA